MISMPIIRDISKEIVSNWPVTYENDKLVRTLIKQGDIQILGSIMLIRQKKEVNKNNIFDEYFEWDKND